MTLTVEVHKNTSDQIMHSRDANTWPEDTPGIAVDVGLAETGKNIDFDMAGYYELLKNRIGIDTPNDVVKAIELVRKGGIKKASRASGYADPDSKTAYVVKKDDKKTTKNLLHETGHLIDYATGQFDPKTGEKMRKRALLLMVVSRLAVLGGGITLARVGAAGSIGELSEITAATLAVTGVLNPLGNTAGRLSAFASYRMDSTERRARKFAEENQGRSSLVSSRSE